MGLQVHGSTEVKFMRRVMKLTRTIGPAFLLIVAAGCATQPASNDGIYMAAGGDNANPDRIVCHNVAPTGSRLSKRDCRTAREWEALAEANQEEKRNLQRGTAPLSDLPTMGN
jgi:hypothetical protein